MAIIVLTGKTQTAGVNYNYTTSGSSDWSGIPSSTYFYDQIDKLVRYKNSSGTILDLFFSGGTSSSLTVGTTPITSGTDTRILFQNGGVLQQDTSFTFTQAEIALRIARSGTPTSPLLSLGNSTASAKSGLKIWNGSTTEASGAELFVNTDNNIYLKSNNANSIILASSTTNVLTISANQASISRLNINGASTTPVFSVASEGTTSTDYPFYISGLSGSKVNVMNGLGQFGINKPSNTLGANLDVSASGPLSTDTAFRVRNSINTFDLVSINGIGDILLGANATTTLGTGGNGTVIAIGENAAVNSGYNKSPIAIGKNSVSNGNAIAIGNGSSNGTGQTISANIAIGENAINTNSTLNCIAIGSSVQTGFSPNTIAIGGNINFSGYSGGGNISVGYNFNGGNFITDAYAFGRASSATTLDIANSFSIFINRTTRSFFVNQNSNLVFRTNNTLTSGTHFDVSATNTFTVHNGVPPATNITDAIQMYSNDIVSNNAAPHFRTENGDIIKLYKETTGVTASTLVSNGGTTITDTDTFDGYTIQKVVKALRNLGILA